MEEISKKLLGYGLSAVCAASAVTNMAACSKVKQQQYQNETQESKTVQEEKEETSMLLANELPESYGSKAVRALESVKAQYGDDTYLQMVGTLGNPEKADSKGEYIAKLLNSMETAQQDTKKVMRACGYQCIGDQFIASLKEMYGQSKDLDSFIEKLNQKGIGGGHMIKEGNIIHATYDDCYCNVDNKKKLPGCYCQCSCGWFEKLFVGILEKPVTVDLEQSIISGGNQCDFTITLSE